MIVVSMPSRRQFLLGSTALPLFAQKKPAAERPNLVVMVTAGVGAWMLGCYGNREVRTPNLDRMAQAGARFAAAFSSAGTPAEGRAGLLNGVTAALDSAGYACGEAAGPAGACRWIEQQAAGKPFCLTVDLPLKMEGRDARFDAMYAQSKFDSVSYEPVSAKAAVHREVFAATVANIRKAAAAVTALDAEVPAVLDCVRRRGLTDTSLIVFTSACGALLGRHGLWGDALASNPPNLYDEVVAVPMIWNWSARIPPASVRPELVSASDFLPTVCELSGAAASAGAGRRSYLLPAMNRPLPDKQRWRNLVTARVGDTAMARDNRFKLVLRNNGAGPNELYDVSGDPREKVNQYDNPQYITVRARLEGELKSGQGK